MPKSRRRAYCSSRISPLPFGYVIIRGHGSTEQIERHHLTSVGRHGMTDREEWLGDLVALDEAGLYDNGVIVFTACGERPS